MEDLFPGGEALAWQKTSRTGEYIEWRPWPEAARRARLQISQPTDKAEKRWMRQREEHLQRFAKVLGLFTARSSELLSALKVNTS
jgi:hypothetical protein